MRRCELHSRLPPSFGAHGSVNQKKKDVAAREQSKAASEEAPQPTKREQETTEKKPKAPVKRAQRPKPLTQEGTTEKKPEAPIKRSLKDEEELEREERIQKTERLRKLRLTKEAADREKNPSSNGRDEDGYRCEVSFVS